MVKFIHCSDLHLDSPFKSKSHISPKIFEDVQKSAYESFKNIVDIALQQDVDFVIIAGDLFDSENRTLRAEIFLKQQFERLQNEQIFVYVCHGNHDPFHQRFHQTGQIMFLYFQIKLRRMKQLLNLVKQFIFTDLVMKIEQVMRTRLMNIHQVKAKKAYILVSCMVRIVNLQLTKDIPSSF